MSKTQLNYLTEKFNIVGKDTLRIDSNEKITGNAIFGTDVNLPNMLYAKILRSKISHGKIISIDLSKMSLTLELVPAVKVDGCSNIQINSFA